jgi:hypothetical protein
MVIDLGENQEDATSVQAIMKIQDTKIKVLNNKIKSPNK